MTDSISGHDPKPSLLEHLVGYHLRRASTAVATDFNQALVDTGVRQVLFGVAAVIAEHPGINQGAIGRRLGIKRANMVALINELLERGVVERRAAAGDRRAFALYLSPHGEQAFRSWTDAIEAHEEKLFGDFSPGERTILIELLRRIGTAAPSAGSASDD